MGENFIWRDAGRTVLLREGGLHRAVELLGRHGCERFELLATPRSLAAAGELAGAAAAVHEVAPGAVADAAAALRPALDGRLPLVALGGGRVIDCAKALASVLGLEVATLATTMSGAEMTSLHALPAGDAAGDVARTRPRLVIADPELMTDAPEPALRASSMNALAHAADSVYTPLANPVSLFAARRGAELIAAALDRPRDERPRAELALGSLLCGYAIDSALFGLHHVVCQTFARVCGTAHAQTNAAVLPPRDRLAGAARAGADRRDRGRDRLRSRAAARADSRARRRAGRARRARSRRGRRRAGADGDALAARAGQRPGPAGSRGPAGDRRGGLVSGGPVAGRVALVTGASAGIGAATVRALADAGMAVAFSARGPQAVADLEDELTAGRADGARSGRRHGCRRGRRRLPRPGRRRARSGRRAGQQRRPLALAQLPADDRRGLAPAAST